MDNHKNDIDRRTLRRRRRRRNQLIAYGIVIILLFAAITLLVIGTSKVIGWIQSSKQEAEQLIQEQQEQQEELLEKDKIEVSDTPEEQTTQHQDEIIRTEDDGNGDLRRMVDEFIADMTLEEKAAAVFMVTPEAITGVDAAIQAGGGTQEALAKYSVGGFLYQAKNIKSAEQIQQMLANTAHYSKYPMFYAISEESGNGTIMKISSLGAEQTDSAWDLAQTGEQQAVSEAYRTIGDYLTTIGFNMNFAPIADVLTNDANKELQGRTFGDNPETAKDLIALATEALQEQKVSAVLMKFPGEGDIEAGEKGVSVTNKSLSELKDKELLTFKAGIEAGADCVMVSHICAPTITGDTTPSSLSQQMLQDVLRGEMGFDGIIITDALDKKIITEQYSSAEAALKALEAGADILLQPQNFEEAYQGVLQALQSGSLSQERIDDAIRRSFMVKYRNTLE